MSTHAIGTGTCNVPINLPIDVREILGRSAVGHAARSTGEWARRLILKGLEAEDPSAALAMRAALRRYYGAALLVLFLAFVLPTSQDMRRARTVRRNRIETEEVAS